jgi:hypothetical protein
MIEKKGINYLKNELNKSEEAIENLVNNLKV